MKSNLYPSRVKPLFFCMGLGLLAACGDPTTEEAKQKLAAKNVEITGDSLIAKTKSGSTEDTAKLLVIAGADPNATQANGMTVLMSAVFNGQLDVARSLIEKGAKIDASAQGFTALSLAVDRGDTAMIQLLLDAGADPISRPPAGLTALEKAQQKGDANLIKLLEKAKK